MRKMMIVTALAGLVSGASGQAQDVVRWPAPIANSGPSETRYFPMGTRLMLTTRSDLSTKVSKTGDRFYLEVAEDLAYRGQVVVPAGSLAVGEVVRSESNGHFGKKGEIDIRLLHIETPSGRVPINGYARDEGTSNTAVSIATIALVSTLGFLIRGTSGYIPSGTRIEAALAEPITFAWQAPRPWVATAQSADAGMPAGLEAAAR